MCLDTKSNVLNLVDERGNRWSCTLEFVPGNDAHFNIGGEWSRMVMARRLKAGSRVLIGAPRVGMNATIFFAVIRR